MYIFSRVLLLGVATAVDAAAIEPKETPTIPDYFQTSYGPFAGMYIQTPAQWSLKC